METGQNMGWRLGGGVEGSDDTHMKIPPWQVVKYISEITKTTYKPSKCEPFWVVVLQIQAQVQSAQ